MAGTIIGLTRGFSTKHNNKHRRGPSAQEPDIVEETIHYTPSPYNSEFGLPPRRATVGVESAPPPYTEVASTNARVPQSAAPTRSATQRQERSRRRAPTVPLAESTSIPTRSATQSQPRRERSEQTQLPVRNATQSQPKPEPAKIVPPARVPTEPPRAPVRSQSQSASRARPATPPQYTIPPPYPPKQAAAQSPTKATPRSPQDESKKYVVVDATPDTGMCNCIYKDGFGLAPKCRKCERNEKRGGTGNGERRRRREKGGPTNAVESDKAEEADCPPGWI